MYINILIECIFFKLIGEKWNDKRLLVLKKVKEERKRNIEFIKYK